jgi:hypothetical protein
MGNEFLSKGFYFYNPSLMVGEYVKCSEEFYNLYAQWQRTDGRVDGQLSGIIADFLEDHPGHVEEWHNLREFIDTFRSYFYSPGRNLTRDILGKRWDELYPCDHHNKWVKND